jgi:hypothetical protein
MKKIKITERQAELLKNSLNTKKVIKITESQYKSIIESELTPEVTEEKKINEELFKEFINELYGMNEEGSKRKFEKLTKLMEVAGLIKGGKISKDKFKDINNVKEVITKGLEMLEECGSEYQAVEMMEGMTNADIKQSFTDQLQGKPSKNYAPDVENSYTPSSSKLKDDTTNEPENNPEYRQLELPLDEREEFEGKRAVGLDILNVSPFSELPETRSDVKSAQDRIELTLPSLKYPDGTNTILSKDDLIGSEFQGPKMMHKNLGYIKIFKSKFGSEPVFTNITDKGAEIDLNLAPKFREWKVGGTKAKKGYMELDEMDIATSGVDVTAPVGPLNGANNEEESFESNVAKKIYDLLKKNVENDSVTEENEEILDEATTTANAGNYAYDINAFQDVNMKGNHETGAGNTFKTPTMKGGSFVRVKKNA